MKLIGFIKEHGEFKFSKSLDNYIDLDIPTPERVEVINYLQKGTLCVALMGVAEHQEEIMGYIGVDTDGEWLWPQYLIGYLKKYPNFKIESDFIKHILKSKGKQIILSDEENILLERKFYKEAGFK